MEETNKTSKTNKKLVGVLALVLLVAAFAVIFIVFREKPVEGSKQISIEVVGSTQSTTVYKLWTDAEYLRQAMEEADGLTFSGAESEYGMMVDTVNGELADFAENGAYWAFYVNDEYCNYGIDTQPVEDNDVFRIVYTVYVPE